MSLKNNFTQRSRKKKEELALVWSLPLIWSVTVNSVTGDFQWKLMIDWMLRLRVHGLKMAIQTQCFWLSSMTSVIDIITIFKSQRDLHSSITRSCCSLSGSQTLNQCCIVSDAFVSSQQITLTLKLFAHCHRVVTQHRRSEQPASKRH